MRPNENVLPLYYWAAWYDDGKYSKTPKLYPAEMREDVMERIQTMFPDSIIQNIEDSHFDEVESLIREKSYKDVVVINGSDSLLTCEETVMKGKELIEEKYSLEKYNKNLFYLGKYEHCIDFEADMEYIVRVERKTGCFGEDIYTIKSIK
jgi:hypothetical protein